MPHTALSSKVTARQATSWCDALAPHLHDDESLAAFARTNLLRPMMDGLAVTDTRLLGLRTPTLASDGPRRQIEARNIAGFRFARRFGTRQLVVTPHQGAAVSFGAISDAEIDFVGEHVGRLVSR